MVHVLAQRPRWMTSRNLMLLSASVVMVCWLAVISRQGPTTVPEGRTLAVGKHKTSNWHALHDSTITIQCTALPPLADAERTLADGWSNSVAIPKPHKTNSKVHVIFSTDCSAFQNWQSYVVFFSAEIAGHTVRAIVEQGTLCVRWVGTDFIFQFSGPYHSYCQWLQS